MEQYKKVVKLRIGLFALLLLVCVGLGVYDVFWATPAMKVSYIFGYQCGVATGLGVLSFVVILLNSAALRNETKLKIQFNKEHDERMKAIRAKAGMPMLLIASIGMIVAGVVIGYRNPTVFFTLSLAAMCQLTVGAVVKIVYMKRM